MVDMDSLTQVALGAAVGEATLGRRVGNTAPLWGAFFGTLPDLDVLAYPFLDTVGQLAFHRGPTHSLLFSFMMAPLFGWALGRLHKKKGVDWRSWALLVWACLITHPLLDAFTAYGTQLFWPFTNANVAFNTINIIDLLYTLPLLIGVGISMFRKRTTPARSRPNRVGLIISTLYLAFTIGNHLYVKQAFQANWAAAGVVPEQATVMPTLGNNVLWNGLALADDTLYVGAYSILDADRVIALQAIPRNTHLLDGLYGRGLDQVLWFSMGYYTIEQTSMGLQFNDLHIGRGDQFLTEAAPSIFAFRLVPEDGSPQHISNVRQLPQGIPTSGDTWRMFGQRILGNE
ncbi:MAG: metal-dependent hydrolase [Rhodothermales bacterium]